MDMLTITFREMGQVLKPGPHPPGHGPKPPGHYPDG